MLLPDEVLADVVSSLDNRERRFDPHELAESRRREARVGVAARVTLIPVTDSLAPTPFEVPLRDLSAGGIGFLHTHRIGLDEQFVVLLPDGLAVLCRVAYYQPLAERLFAVGAKFVRVLRQTTAAGETLPMPSQRPADPRRLAS